jgi:Zn ribbon nucleic-acid-binding protein
MDEIEECFETQQIICPQCEKNFLFAQFWGGDEYRIACLNRCGFDERNQIKNSKDFEKYKEKIEKNGKY